MRIKFLKQLPDFQSGTTHEVGAFLTVDDDAVATKYVKAGYAEEAPDEPADLSAQIRGLFSEAITGLRDEMKAAGAKATGPGHQVTPVADPNDPAEPPRESDSPALRQKKFGRYLQVVGTLGSPDASREAVGKAAETLQNCYKASYNSWGDKAVIKAANIEASGPAGGYTVPPEFSTDIYKLAIEDTVLASRARKRPMTSNEFRYPKLDQTGTQATGQTGYLGGVIARWSRETATRIETEPKLKQGVMKAGELTGYSVISNELLQDNAAGLAALISELFAEAISYYTDLATLVGDGVDKPLGVVNAPCTLTTGPNSGGRTTASTVKYADLAYMRGLLLPKSAKTAFWVFNQTVMNQLLTMQDGSSRNIWLPNFPGGNAGPVSGGGAGTILDLPYVFTEKTPVLGTAGDALLVDPQGYMIGERMGLEIAASPHVNFLANEMTYRFVARVAGQPLLDKSFTMIDGTNKLSTFVALN